VVLVKRVKSKYKCEKNESFGLRSRPICIKPYELGHVATLMLSESDSVTRRSGGKAIAITPSKLFAAKETRDPPRE
jgi:hypothetical protein